MNAELVEHLSGGGTVDLALVLEGFLHLMMTQAARWTLGRKAARLLVKNVALVRAQLDGEADLVNLG